MKVLSPDNVVVINLCFQWQCQTYQKLLQTIVLSHIVFSELPPINPEDIVYCPAKAQLIPQMVNIMTASGRLNAYRSSKSECAKV